MTDPHETLADLLQRDSDEGQNPPDVLRVSFATALQEGDDPLHILRYFAGLGIAVQSLEDLLTINDDGTEEELHCFRVAEGVAVTVASDGLWQLFTT